MNYYKHHIGDYDAATSHLTMTEDGAYRRLLCLYYRKEQPIPLSIDAACRLVRATTKQDREAVAAVLREFFTETSDGWRHGRCDAEILESQEIARRNRENGKSGGRPVRSGNPKETQEKPGGLSVGSVSVPSGNLSHKPLAISQEEANKSDDLFVDSKPSTCPHQDIIAAYHELLPSLARVREWTPERQSFLRKRWAEKPERQSLDWWREFFVYVGQSDFLMGRRESRDGAFECDLEWLIRPKNFVKVIEGRYENRERAA